MNWNAAIKYGASSLIMGALLLLVLKGMMDPQAFITLAVGLLAGLGGHAAGSSSASATRVSPAITVAPKP